MENKLSVFGNLLMKEVRDNTLFALEGIISGHMKSPVDKEMHEEIAKMSVEDKRLLKEMFYRAVDLSLHNMLTMFENSQNWIIADKIDMGSLANVSVGLAGELYTDEGWIKQFSQYEISRGL